MQCDTQLPQRKPSLATHHSPPPWMPVASTTLRAYSSSGAAAPVRSTVTAKPPEALLGCSGSIRSTCKQGKQCVGRREWN